MDLPSFIREDSEFWFSLVENLFKSKKINNPTDKFNAILLVLPHHLQLEAKPFLKQLTSTEDNATGSEAVYATFKKKIIELTSVTEDRRLQELLDEAHIGTRIPSQFLTYLRNLQGDAGDANSKILRLIFLRNLPNDIRNIIVSQGKNDLDAMAQTADLLWEKPNSSVTDTSVRARPSHAVISQPTPDEALIQQIVKLKSSHKEEASVLHSELRKLSERLESMQSEFEHSIRSLRSELNSLKYQHHHEVSQHPPSLSKATGWTGDDAANPLCYYHKRFGNAAFKCTQPCTFVTRQGNWNSASQ